MQISERLKSIREEKNMQQQEVASILGIKQQAYSRYEKGINEIPIRHIINLAKYYNISADYILGIIEEKKSLNN